VIHLDTSYLIRALVAGSAEDRALRKWLKDGVPLGMSVIAWAEFLCGPIEVRHVELATRVIPEHPPFVSQDAILAAELFNQAGRRRGSLIDCMIAATAIRLGAALATANRADFRRLAASGLVLAEP
jgi:predicted nucleic acid-binding protein